MLKYLLGDMMQKILLKLGIFFITIGVIFSVYLNFDDVLRFYRDVILKERDNIVITKNDYYRDYDFEFVQNTDNFIIKDEKQIKNIIYTILNSGVDEFSFFCDYDYKDCLSKIKEVSQNQALLSHINNFVHPYNSFKSLSTSYSEYGKITLEVKKNYNDDEIKAINKKVSEIKAKYINDKMSITDKIETIHNYIIDNSVYEDSNDEHKNTAYGVLLNGKGVCGSYSDAMAIFLDEFKIKNYKISSEAHVWNLVNINNSYLHLDLTWDDPITNTGEYNEKYRYLFFLIDTTRLIHLSDDTHKYDKEIYKEAK